MGYVKFKIEITVPFDSDLFRMARENAGDPRDLRLTILMLKLCANLGIEHHIRRNLKLLAHRAKE